MISGTVKDQGFRQGGTELPAGTEVILVVDDDQGVREFTALLLKRLGYAVLSAEDGETALALAAKAGAAPIDLVLTDMIMPNMSGRVLAERILKVQPASRFLFISGYTADMVKQGGALVAGAGFLAKPYKFQELAAKVRELLDARPA